MNISHHNCLWCNCQQHLPTDMSDVAMFCGWDMKNLKRSDDIGEESWKQSGRDKEHPPSGFWESASLGMVYRS